MIPPPYDFLEESDLGAGKCKMWIGVRPWPDETLAGYLQPFEKARNCILVTIGPATDGIDWALDRGVVLAHRPMLPIRIAPLVLKPIFLEQRYALQAFQPHRSPAVADQRRIGRKARQAEKEKGPLKSSLGEKRATHVVCVIGVPIVGRTNGDDGFEGRGTARRNLKPLEPPPGNSHHPNRAIAPGLRCQPGDQLHAIVLFLLGVLVRQQARRFAAAAKVDANTRVAVTGQIGMSQRVPLVGAVALTIWEKLKDCRYRVLFGILRQPDASRQRGTVSQRYQSMLDDAHSSGEGRDNHRGTPIGNDYGTPKTPQINGDVAVAV